MFFHLFSKQVFVADQTCTLVISDVFPLGRFPKNKNWNSFVAFALRTNYSRRFFYICLPPFTAKHHHFGRARIQFFFQAKAAAHDFAIFKRQKSLNAAAQHIANFLSRINVIEFERHDFFKLQGKLANIVEAASTRIAYFNHERR